MQAEQASAAEGRRQAYLAALGVPLWSSRQVLPHAPVSDGLQAQPWWDDSSPVLTPPELERAAVSTSLPAAAPPAAALSTPPAAVATELPASAQDDDLPPLDAYLDDPEIRQAMTAGPQSAKALARQSGLAVEPPAATPVALPEPVLPAADRQPISFRFALYACGPWQLLVLRPQLLSPSEQTLLLNIQRAMQHEQPPVPLHFAWPLINNPGLPQHRHAAREALTAFFRSQGVSDRGYVLLADHEDDMAALFAASTTLPVRVQPALATLLQQPLLKRTLWYLLNSVAG